MHVLADALGQSRLQPLPSARPQLWRPRRGATGQAHVASELASGGTSGYTAAAQHDIRQTRAVVHAMPRRRRNLETRTPAGESPACAGGADLWVKATGRPPETLRVLLRKQGRVLGRSPRGVGAAGRRRAARAGAPPFTAGPPLRAKGAMRASRPAGGAVTFPAGPHNGHVSPVLGPRSRRCAAKRPNEASAQTLSRLVLLRASRASAQPPRLAAGARRPSRRPGARREAARRRAQRLQFHSLR